MWNKSFDNTSTNPDFSRDPYFFRRFGLFASSGGHVQPLFVTGVVLTYVAVFFNVIVLVILRQKQIRSPSTILIQGLALADMCSAFCAYGLEPLFLTKYKTNDHFTKFMLTLNVPFCAIYFHITVLSVTFHNVSFMLTTSLGLQKVIAIMFPLWTKRQMTQQRAIQVCGFCFMLALTIGLPRNFAVIFWERYSTFENNSECFFETRSLPLLRYSGIYYIFIQAVILMMCCCIMLSSTIYIVYKLIKNKFRGRQQRRKEKRSALMVVAVLVVFMLTEVPKLFFYCISFSLYAAIGEQYLGELYQLKTLSKERFYFNFILDFENVVLVYTSFLLYSEIPISYILILPELVKLSLLLGCLSNLLIYIVMSKILRTKFKNIFKCRECCN